MRNILMSVKPRTLALIKRFQHEVAGVAAIEFAIIAPIMLLLFFATIEVSTALSVNRKIARVSSTLGDLITQSQTLTESDVEDIIKAASYVMNPYEHSLTIVITQVNIKSGAATVDWSKSNISGKELIKGTNYTVPSKISTDDTYLVSAKVTASHIPLYASVSLDKHRKLTMDTGATGEILMEEEIFLRPRVGLKTSIK